MSTARATSIDPKEVAYYEALAETWWNTRGPFWPLHRLNEVRRRYIRDQLCTHFDLDRNAKQPLRGIKMLDVGCGGGILSESMARMGASVHGIDIVQRNIEVARVHAHASNVSVRYECATAEQFAEGNKAYDAVLNMEVVEHVANVPSFMRACSELVRPDGMMFVSTINRNLLSWLFAIVGAEYILRWLPRGTHRWHKFPKPEELTALLAHDKLSVIDRAGVRVNPFTRSFRLTSNLTVNYMLTAARTHTPAH